MRRWIPKIAGGLAVLVVMVGVALWWLTGRITIEPVAERLSMLQGVGGNVGVLTTPGGAVVVDTMTLVRQGEAILRQIGKLTKEPVVAVINTHYHLDHTHGNPAFSPDTKVIATERTLHHLQTLDADFWREPPARDLLPDETFSDEREYRFGDDVVRVAHLGRGHTDGDLVVLFERQRVVHLGDLLFHGHYPNIDLEAGGSIREWIDTLERVKALPFDRVIPGHGPVTDRAGIDAFQSFLRALWEETGKVAAAGGSIEDARSDVDVRRFGLTPVWFAPFLNHDFVVGRAWEEHTAGRR